LSTAELINNEKATTIATSIKHVIQLYHRFSSKYNIYMATGSLSILGNL